MHSGARRAGSSRGVPWCCVQRGCRWLALCADESAALLCRPAAEHPVAQSRGPYARDGDRERDARTRSRTAGCAWIPGLRSGPRAGNGGRRAPICWTSGVSRHGPAPPPLSVAGGTGPRGASARKRLCWTSSRMPVSIDTYKAEVARRRRSTMARRSSTTCQGLRLRAGAGGGVVARQRCGVGPDAQSRTRRATCIGEAVYGDVGDGGSGRELGARLDAGDRLPGSPARGLSSILVSGSPNGPSTPTRHWPSLGRLVRRWSRPILVGPSRKSFLGCRGRWRPGSTRELGKRRPPLRRGGPRGGAYCACAPGRTRWCEVVQGGGCRSGRTGCDQSVTKDRGSHRVDRRWVRLTERASATGH